MSDPSPLAPFHPVVREWFGARYGAPTEVQTAAWPVIAEGRHVLATAPTGSGKTLAAFLWSLDRLLTGTWEGGRTRVLYVSPLKALNNDVQRNLLTPLAELQAAFERAGVEVPPVTVATRSGDTPPRERQRMLRRPPEILITTPESLNILLTSQGGRRLLGGLRTVLLDEVHAVAGEKRGTHLITAVDRLVPLAGELQRIALSATVRPLERIARFVGGWELERRGDVVSYRRREVSILDTPSHKVYEVTVDFPCDLAGRPSGGVEQSTLPIPTDPTGSSPAHVEVDPDLFWPRLVRDLKSTIGTHRSTLVFANSRRLAERVTRMINEDEPSDLVYSHHGSLAREIRTTVEERFKQGRLAGIVATNSLELGIDIGDLDEVVLLQTPFSIASAVQRVGRAGHAVGAVSRGTFRPLFGRDLLAAAVVARAVLEQDIEPMTPVEAPLDVLAQVILSMTAAREWDVDELFDQIRTSEPYHSLDRSRFDAVLEMLAGRYAATRLRELVPRIDWNRLENRVSARRSAARLIYTSGGTIPDRGYYQLRLQGSMARIGELDEEFVWERKINDRFTLGTQSWRIVQITHHDVIVTPAGGGSMAPFWRGESLARPAHLAEALGRFLEWAEGRLAERGRQAGSLAHALQLEYPVTEGAGRCLVQFLEAQRAATGRALPHRRHLLVERVRPPGETTTETSLILHTGWGGRVNRPWALALAAAWERELGTVVDVTQDDDGLLIQAPHDVDTRELLELVTPEAIEELLRGRLEISGFFGAHFRQNAGRALLLPRAGFDRRVPLWLNRQRSKKLLSSVAKFQDFPIVFETWRTCLEDEFDLHILRRRLEELADGTIEVTECVTSAPSPFAANLSWNLTNRLMYADDAAEGGTGPALGPELLRELVHSSQLRPRIAPALAEELRSKLGRTHPGYAPAPGPELVEWIKERIVLPLPAWRELLAAVERDHGTPAAEIIADASTSGRLVEVREGEEAWVLALESLPLWRRARDDGGQPPTDPRFLTVDDAKEVPTNRIDELTAGLAGELPDSASDAVAAILDTWLRWETLVPSAELSRRLGLDGNRLREAIESLVAARTVVVDELSEGATEPEVCDAENLERMLRLARRRRRPSIEARPLAELPLFLAVHQGVAPRGDGIEGLEDALERLFAYPAPAAAWEGDLLPARLDPYDPSWLDSLMQEGELVWVGTDRERLTFLLRQDLDLRPVAADDGDADEAEGASENPAAVPEALAGGGHLTLGEMVRGSGRDSGKLTRDLWELAWRGRVTNDTFAVVRRGIGAKFTPETESTEGTAPPRRAGRGRRSRWGRSRALVGRWHQLQRSEAEDVLAREESRRERARIVLHRYGVVFRELLLREGPGYRWGDLFPALRLMELAGEIASGVFFDGVPGPQFATPAALGRLRRGLPEDLVFWCSALDPVAPCGLGTDLGLGQDLDLDRDPGAEAGPPFGAAPRRLAGNHLVFHGHRLVLVSERRGGRLEFHVPPDHPRLADYLEPLHHLLARAAGSSRSIDVEEINGEAARASPYRPALSREFEVSLGARSLRLWRRW